MKIILFGYGKMGKAIEQTALQRNHKIIFRVTRTTAKEDISPYLTAADVALEFSAPEVAYDNVVHCLQANVPVVCGTTGWFQKFNEAKKICKEYNGAFFYASNFSIGMNIVFALNQQLAEWMNSLPQYEVCIEEIHHQHKKDSPSGTAITLANDIVSHLNRKHHWVNKQAVIPEELSIISHRKGNLPGTHVIRYKSEYDTIELSHIAHSREGFALGAVLAAEWLIGKKGFFEMNDFLNLSIKGQ